MLRIVKKSKRNIQDLRDRAIKFFGPNGFGMSYKEPEPSTLSFEGGGGGVEVIIVPENGHNSVEVVTREWDYQAKQFLESI